MVALSDLDGIGHSREKRLIDAGIQDVEALVNATDDVIAKVAEQLGVSAMQVANWRGQAWLMSSDVESDEKTSEEVPERDVAVDINDHEFVYVRVMKERGLLGGRAVWRNEVHRVPYWQYVAAIQADPNGYELKGRCANA